MPDNPEQEGGATPEHTGGQPGAATSGPNVRSGRGGRRSSLRELVRAGEPGGASEAGEGAGRVNDTTTEAGIRPDPRAEGDGTGGDSRTSEGTPSVSGAAQGNAGTSRVMGEGRGNGVRDNQSLRVADNPSGASERQGRTGGGSDTVTYHGEDENALRLLEGAAGKVELPEPMTQPMRVSDPIRERMRAAFGSGPSVTEDDGEPGPFLAPISPARPAAPTPPASRTGTVRKPVTRSGATKADAPLTASENELLIQALCEFSEMMDQGLWYLGLDTDATMPRADGSGMGMELWTMSQEEAETLAKAILRRGERYGQVYVAAREVIAAYQDVQAGLILGSRIGATVVAFFMQGFNFRMSRREFLVEAEKRSPQRLNG